MIKYDESRDAYIWSKNVAGVKKQLQSNILTHGNKLDALKDIMKKVREALLSEGL